MPRPPGSIRVRYLSGRLTQWGCRAPLTAPQGQRREGCLGSLLRWGNGLSLTQPHGGGGLMPGPSAYDNGTLDVSAAQTAKPTVLGKAYYISDLFADGLGNGR